MKNIFNLVILIGLLMSCSNDEPYVSPLPGIWKIEKVYGPHADQIRGGYMEFDDKGNFTWSTRKTVAEGKYEDLETHFNVQYKGYEIKKRFDFYFEKGYLVVVPEISTQKFFLKKVE